MGHNTTIYKIVSSILYVKLSPMKQNIKENESVCSTRNWAVRSGTVEIAADKDWETRRPGQRQKDEGVMVDKEGNSCLENKENLHLSEKIRKVWRSR